MSNFTYTVTSITGAVGTSAGTQTVTATLTPLTGYRLVASDFSVDNTLGIYENIVVSKVGTTVIITLDLINSILYDSTDVQGTIDIVGDAKSVTVSFIGDIIFDDTPDDGIDFIVRNDDGDPIPDGDLDIDIEGDEGDRIVVGDIIITPTEGGDLPDSNGDGIPDILDIVLPVPFELGDGVENEDGDIVYDIIVIIPGEDIINPDVIITSGDVIVAGGGGVVITPTPGFTTAADPLLIDSIDVNTDDLDGLNGGFIVVTALGDPGATATITITPTILPSTSSATYPNIVVSVLIGPNGRFVKTIRIPRVQTDTTISNALCIPDTNGDVEDINWDFVIVGGGDTEIIADPIDTIIQNPNNKITIRIYGDDGDIPQANEGGAVITSSTWTHDTVLGPNPTGSAFNGGFISLTIPSGIGTWTLLGTAAEVSANLSAIKEGQELVLQGSTIDPLIDFCKGSATVDSNGDLVLLIEYSKGVIPVEDVLFKLDISSVATFVRPAVEINFTNGTNYSVSKTKVIYRGATAANVSGTELSVVLTANSGYTWHSTDIAATVASFVAVAHSQAHIASMTFSPTTSSLGSLAFSGTRVTELTLSWTLTGVYGTAEEEYNFTPTGGPRAISNITFNTGANNRGANAAQTTMAINSLVAITSVESRAWSINYTLTADGSLIFDNPHLTTLTTTGATATVTGPTLVGSGPVYTQINGSIQGTVGSTDDSVVVNINGSAYIDTDGDGDPDITDPDDDGDGTLDVDDAFPLDGTEDTDTDGDGTGDNADLDDDGDGVLDVNDAFPLDNTEDTDTDGDGIGDNADLDDDGDGTLDVNDAFPLDSTEDTDTDGDGIGDNADPDDDNDGTLDAADAFPLDPTEDTDTDGDGIGNNADLDDDGDGASDVIEISQGTDPLDPNDTPVDTDGDGIYDGTDPDDDNDGFSDVDEIAAGTNPLVANTDAISVSGTGLVPQAGGSTTRTITADLAGWTVPAQSANSLYNLAKTNNTTITITKASANSTFNQISDSFVVTSVFGTAIAVVINQEEIVDNLTVSGNANIPVGGGSVTRTVTATNSGWTIPATSGTFTLTRTNDTTITITATANTSVLRTDTFNVTSQLGNAVVPVSVSQDAFELIIQLFEYNEGTQTIGNLIPDGGTSVSIIGAANLGRNAYVVRANHPWTLSGGLLASINNTHIRWFIPTGTPWNSDTFTGGQSIGATTDTIIVSNNVINTAFRTFIDDIDIQSTAVNVNGFSRITRNYNLTPVIVAPTPTVGSLDSVGYENNDSEAVAISHPYGVSTKILLDNDTTALRNALFADFDVIVSAGDVTGTLTRAQLDGYFDGTSKLTRYDGFPYSGTVTFRAKVNRYFGSTSPGYTIRFRSTQGGLPADNVRVLTQAVRPQIAFSLDDTLDNVIGSTWPSEFGTGGYYVDSINTAIPFSFNSNEGAGYGTTMPSGIGSAGVSGTSNGQGVSNGLRLHVNLGSTWTSQYFPSLVTNGEASFLGALVYDPNDRVNNLSRSIGISASSGAFIRPLGTSTWHSSIAAGLAGTNAYTGTNVVQSTFPVINRGSSSVAVFFEYYLPPNEQGAPTYNFTAYTYGTLAGYIAISRSITRTANVAATAAYPFKSITPEISTVGLTSPLNWGITGPAWCTFSPTTGAFGTTTSINVAGNPTGSQRTGNIIITEPTSGNQQSVSVTQRA